MQGQVECHSAPYNLLLTRRWMMLVPRTREHFEEISINAMGFAGSLFVRNEKELLRVKEVGPLHMLGSVSGAV
jgi:ATP adenylyltransferase